MAVVFKKSMKDLKVLEEINSPPSEWIPSVATLDVDLSDSIRSLKRLARVNPSRKWEISSAYQKSVRRGHIDFALKCIYAIYAIELDSPDLEAYKYLWRRACVTVAEDIGNANIPLCYIVVKAASVCIKVSTPVEVGLAVLIELTKLMCVSKKSRLYCQLSIIENAYKSISMFDNLDPKSLKFVNSVTVDVEYKLISEPISSWYKSKSWLTEGMLKYAAYDLKGDYFEPCFINTQYQQNTVVNSLYGLPSYAYDMHTRTGKQAINLLLKDADIVRFFELNNVHIRKAEVLGYALFYVEGSVFSPDYWYYPKVFEVELLAVNKNLSQLNFCNWFEFLSLVANKVRALNKKRVWVLSKTYGV